METVTENLKETPNSTLSFFKYVFNFDDDNKSEMFNLFQYSFLAIIPTRFSISSQAFKIMSSRNLVEII